MMTSEIIRTATASDFTKPVKSKPITWQMLEGYLCKPKVGPKEGNGFVAAAIDDGPRKNERVGSVSLLVYDLDNKNSVVVADELRHRIESKRYRAIIHSTYSHTPDKPRYRLILAVSEPIMPADHKHILISVAAQLCISDALDMNATDLSRFFYRPRCPVEQVGNYVFISVPGAAVDIGSLRSIANQNVIDLCAWRGVDSVNRNLAGVQNLLETDQNYELVRKMLSSVPSDCDRDKWRNIVWSVISLNWSTGKELIREWSMRSDAHWGDPINARKASADLDNVVADYDPMSGTSIGTLFHHAKKSGWDYNDNNEPNETEGADGNGDAPRFRLLSPSDLYKLPPMDWLVKGVLPSQGLASIYGVPGSGKTFLALDLAMAIAKGLSTWFGRKTVQRKVVYLALEGTTGIAKRIRAWETHNQLQSDNFHLIIDPFNLKDPPDVAALIELIQRKLGTNCVVFIDTLSQASPGSDENSPVDMGLLLAAAKAIYKALNGLVVIVHHSGKNAQNGLRGHSSMNGAMDTVILVEKLKGAGRKWRIDKSKDGDGSVAELFDLVSHNVGNDAAGLPETSCAVSPGGAAGLFGPKPLNGNQKIVYEAIGAELKSAGRLADHDCVDIAKAALIAIPSNNRADRAKTALKGLIGSGHLVQDEEGISLPKSPNHPP